MTKISRLLAIASLAGALLTGTAFAQSAATGAMSSSDHMANGSTSSMSHGQMSSGAMSSGDHMKTKHMMKSKHMKSSKHGKNKKKSPHMTSGAMTSGH